MSPVLALGLLLAGCGGRITNLTSKQEFRSTNGLYAVEAAFNSRQQSLRWQDVHPTVIVDNEAFPLHRTELMTNRWETYLQVPEAGNTSITVSSLITLFHRDRQQHPGNRGFAHLPARNRGARPTLASDPVTRHTFVEISRSAGVSFQRTAVSSKPEMGQGDEPIGGSGYGVPPSGGGAWEDTWLEEFSTCPTMLSPYRLKPELHTGARMSAPGPGNWALCPAEIHRGRASARKISRRIRQFPKMGLWWLGAQFRFNWHWGKRASMPESNSKVGSGARHRTHCPGPHLRGRGKSRKFYLPSSRPRLASGPSPHSPILRPTPQIRRLQSRRRKR